MKKFIDGEADFSRLGPVPSLLTSSLFLGDMLHIGVLPVTLQNEILS